MELIKAVDSHSEDPCVVSPPRYHRGFHPSGASCVVKDEYDEETITGKCLRASFWAFKSIKKSNPMNARGKRICSVGSMVERWEVDRYKEMGIWRGNNVKFQNKDSDISGEVDAFVYDEKGDEVIGVEIKSGYGYQFQSKVIGKPGRKGNPKLDHLMQVMLYMDYFRDTRLFKLVYVDRGNAARCEFDITIDKKDGGVKVDGKRFQKELTIPSILHRFNILKDHLDNDSLPVRDYQLQYTDERVQFLHDSKRLNKAQERQYEKEQKVELGDWRCIAKGTKILTNNGWIQIEDVNPTMKVMTRNGLKPVKRVRKTKENAEVVTVKPYLLSDYKATRDHKILIGTSNSYHRLRDKINDNIKFTEIQDIDTSKINFLCMPIDNTVSGDLSDEEILCLSNFITEGSYHKNEDNNVYKCQFTYNVNERATALAVGIAAKLLGATSFKIKTYVDIRSGKEQKSLQLKVYGVEFIRFLKKYIKGYYSYDKSFSEKILTLPLEKQEILLDRMVVQDGAMLNMRDSLCWNYSTTSKQLALQVQQIMFRLNRVASIVKQKGGNVCFDKYISRDCYHVRWFPKANKHRGFFVDDMFFARLNSIQESENIDVYDIEVNDIHEYVTEGGLVHNCSYCDYKDYCWKGGE